MHAYLSDVVATAHRADLLAEGALRRDSCARAGCATRDLGQRFTAWVDRVRAGRPAVVCCPA